MTDATSFALPRLAFALARLLGLATALTGATALAQPQGLPQVELERLTLNPSGQGSLL